MSLQTPREKIKIAPLRKEIMRDSRGFGFVMRLRGSSRTLSVVVSDEALLMGNRKATDIEMQAKFESNLAYFQYLAGEKFHRGRLAADGAVLITAEDVLPSLD